MRSKSDLIKLLAQLAKLKLTPEEEKLLSSQLPGIIKYISNIKSLDTKGVSPVYHTNISKVELREDKKESNRQLSRDKALANAKRAQNGYFVVDAILD